MVTHPLRGEIWWGEAPDVGRRPFLILTRSAAIPVLSKVTVAPITRSIRAIPTELFLDRSDGMPEECAATFDNLAVLPTSYLTSRQCSLSPIRLAEACRALRAATDC